MRNRGLILIGALVLTAAGWAGAATQWAIAFDLDPYGPYTFIAGGELGDPAGPPPSQDGVDPYDVLLDESPETGIWIKSMIGGGAVPYTEDYMAPLTNETPCKVFRHLWVDGWLPPTAGPVTMTWDLSRLPAGWSATLIDSAGMQVIDLRAQDQYVFPWQSQARHLVLEVCTCNPQWAITFDITNGFSRLVVGSSCGAADGVDPMDVQVTTVPLTGVWIASGIGEDSLLFWDDWRAPIPPCGSKHFKKIGIYGWLPDVPTNIQLNFNLGRLPYGWGAYLLDKSVDPVKAYDLREWRSLTFRWNNQTIPLELIVRRPCAAYVRTLYPWWNLIGYMREDHAPVPLADCMIAVGTQARILSWREAVLQGLVADPVFWFQNDPDGWGYRTCSAWLGHDRFLRSGNGYWVLNRANMPLQLLIPPAPPWHITPADVERE